jgi:hypothetical protein
MIDIYGPTQASIFGDFSDIKPKPEIISELLEIFAYKNMLPGTFMEISPSIPAPQSRIRLESEDHHWVINIAFGRIDIEKAVPNNKGDQLDNYYENFIIESTQMLKQILSNFDKKGYRLSFVSKGLLPELSENQLEKIYTNFFTPIDFYNENRPVEWNSRQVARIKFNLDEEEIINVITNVNRTSGQLIVNNEQVDFDGIEIIFDINTFQGNRNTRFYSGNIDPFYSESLKVREKILDQLRKEINV